MHFHATPAAAERVSPKKGVGTWAFAGSNKALTDVKASWFYNWSPVLGGVVGPSDLEFVPMVWGADDAAAASLARLKKPPILIGFNEPDHHDQSDLTVEQALALWPKLEATGAARLGSPATANDPRLATSWLAKFMEGAKAKNLRVDFICVHHYVGNFDPASATAALKSFLEGVHRKYGLPIWLTEYALVRWGNPTLYATHAQQAAFARASAAMMDGLPFVERYAWFALPPSSGAPGLTNSETVSLYTADGTATPTGESYREAGITQDVAATPDAGAKDGASDAITVGGQGGSAGAPVYEGGDDEPEGGAAGAPVGGQGGGDSEKDNTRSKSRATACAYTSRREAPPTLALAVLGALTVWRRRRNRVRRRAPRP